MTADQLQARACPPPHPALLPPPPPPVLDLLHHFASIPDPRVRRTRRHELDEILLVAFCAVLAGADSWTAIQQFGECKLHWLRRFLRLPGGIPSHDTFQRVFAALDPRAFQDAFASWINAVTTGLGLKRFQVDGKALRGTADRAGGLGCLHTVSVWADEVGMTLAQVQVREKSNEITAIPLLLDMLLLEGALVSIDAMGCQTAIAAQIVGGGGDYLLACKGNHDTLWEDVKACVEEALEGDFAGLRHETLVTSERCRGRVETRTYTVIYDPPGLRGRGNWAGLNAVVAVTRERQAGGGVSDETAYYITSSNAGVGELAAAVRAHWDIENGCHWVLDVIFREDAQRCRDGKAPQNLAWLRRMALSLFRQDKGKGGPASKRRRAAWDDSYLDYLLGLLADKPLEVGA